MAHASPQVVYLTPLRLEVALPPSYPSEAPTPQLSAVWLSKSQSQSLAAALVEEAGADGQVGYTWVEWLKASTLPHLGVSDSLLLPLEPSASSSVAALTRQAAGPEDTALNIMRYSASRKHQVWAWGVLGRGCRGTGEGGPCGSTSLGVGVCTRAVPGK